MTHPNLIEDAESFTADSSPNRMLEQIQASAQAISTLTAEVEASIEAFEAIKEFADADDAFLCWKTANDALATLTKGEGDKLP